jgi:hypothetical protein
MDAAEKAGNAVEVPPNFFLFFGSMKTWSHVEFARSAKLAPGMQ